MVAVAVVAVTMGGFVGARAVWQHIVALDRVRYHTGMEGMWRWLDPLGRDQSQETDHLVELISEERRITGDVRLYEDLRASLDEYRRVASLLHRKMEYHAAMARKFRYVVRFPWLPVEPDPPEP
jgi:hypothetical protein